MRTDLISTLHRHALMSVVFLFALGIYSISVSAQTVTFRATHFPTGGQYQTAADFNGDAKVDLATAGQDLEISLGVGDGTFRPVSFRAPAAIGSTASPSAIITCDVNNDAWADIAIAHNAPNQLSIFLGNGDGTFLELERIPTGSGGTPTSLLSADFNRDGNIDFLTTDEIDCSGPCVVTRTVTFFAGNGDGTFAPTEHIDVGPAPSKAAAADLNGDSILDLAVTSGTAGKVYTLLGNGDGTFRQLPDLVVVATTDNTDVAAGDFNSDSIPDLAVAAEGESKIGILIGRGDGTFAAPTIVTDARGQRGASFTTADMNRDGRLDIIVGHSFCCAFGTDLGVFGVMYGVGDGTFQTVTRYIQPMNGRVGLSGWNPVVADFNGDAKPDIAVGYTSNMGGSTIGTLVAINTTGVAPPRIALGSLSVTPKSVIGGTNTQAEISLAPNAVARTGLTTFNITSSDPATVFVPTNSTTQPLGIVGGMTNLRFVVQTASVSTTKTVTITASNKDLGSRSVTLTVTPPTTPLSVGSLQLQPPVVYGGEDTTGVVTLATGHVAPVGGVIVTLNSDSALASVPQSVTIPAGWTNASFPIRTSSTGLTSAVNISASLGGVTKAAVLTVNQPSQNVPFVSLSLSPSTVVGGSNTGVTLTATLASGAPAEGAIFMLSSSDPNIVAVPRSMRIAFPGQTTASTAFTASSVTVNTQVAITATYGGYTQTAVLTVTPPVVSGPFLSGLILNPSTVSGNSTSTGTVVLNLPAATPTTVLLSSSAAPLVAVPASVTIPAGAMSANFPVTVGAASDFTATITASLNGISRSTFLTIGPAPVTTDTVAIQRAEYASGNRELRVEATSTKTNATLQVLVSSTGQVIGTLTNNGGGRYGGQFAWSTNPQNITVKSSLGGQATRAVTLK